VLVLDRVYIMVEMKRKRALLKSNRGRGIISG
jgi:hypothetical protein